VESADCLDRPFVSVWLFFTYRAAASGKRPASRASTIRPTQTLGSRSDSAFPSALRASMLPDMIGWLVQDEATWRLWRCRKCLPFCGAREAERLLVGVLEQICGERSGKLGVGEAWAICSLLCCLCVLEPAPVLAALTSTQGAHCSRKPRRRHSNKSRKYGLLAPS